MTLWLTGLDRLADHVVYLRELHHRGLNDSTAWGTALQVFAEPPPPHRACFLPLLDACRLPHEAFATFAAVNVANARHELAADILERYPAYLPLYRALERLVLPAGRSHRQYLLATALARLAMQTPILDVLLSRSDFRVSPANLSVIDTPDGRWAWFLRQGAALTGVAARAGDDAAGEPQLLALDNDKPDKIASDAYDATWQRWEQAAYAALAAELRGAGATPLEFNGHMLTTPVVLERARELQPTLRLRAARLADPAPDERALAGAAIERVRLTLADHYDGRLIVLAIEQLVEEVDDRCRIGDRPTLVLSARLAPRLLDGYQWSDEDRAALTARTEPVVAAKVVETDDQDVSIAHLTVGTPDGVYELAQRWAGRGPALTVVAASALLDRPWQERWMPAIRALGPLIILIDVALDRFVNGWVRTGTPVNAGLVRVDDTGGRFWAVGITVGPTQARPVNESRSELWLALSDEITTRLFLEQLRQKAGLELAIETAQLESWKDQLPVAVTNILATEPFLDLEGLDERTLQPFTAAPDAEPAGLERIASPR